MIEFMDMNEDCLELVLKLCDPESLTAASQTCKLLNSIAKRLFKNCHNYECDVNTVENVKRAKSTIRNVGEYLNKLTLNIGDEHFEFGSDCMDVLPKMCSYLQSLKVSGAVRPNAVLEAVVNLKQLENVSIKCSGCFSFGESFDSFQLLYLLRIKTELEHLQLFEMTGAHWDPDCLFSFIINENGVDVDIQTNDKIFKQKIASVMFELMNLQLTDSENDE